jgi:alkanesulfonate monooxygenase SsuD/methylene tetrahydromethanopterin reductase-like flavin-dependent oxidoreductase (luciferase family)
MRRLWTNEVASFDGEHLHLSPSRSWPKPRQQPHPPILLGAPAAERTYRRVAAWADGWIPMASPVFDPSFDDQLCALRAAWETAGRAGTPMVMPLLATVRATDMPAALDRLRALGVERAAVHLAEADAATTLRRLDRLAAVTSRRLAP